MAPDGSSSPTPSPDDGRNGSAEPSSPSAGPASAGPAAPGSAHAGHYIAYVRDLEAEAARARDAMPAPDSDATPLAEAAPETSVSLTVDRLEAASGEVVRRLRGAAAGSRGTAAGLPEQELPILCRGGGVYRRNWWMHNNHCF